MRTIRGTVCAALAAVVLGGTAVHGAEMVIEGLEGPVTKGEVESFKAYIKGASFARDNNRNGLVYGSGGMGMEAMGAMYEVSGDVEILDQMVGLSDSILASRNDPKSGKILWTGNRDLAWPNKAGNQGEGKYSGTENGDVIGHMLYPSLLILQNKSLWDKKVGIGDPKNNGLTYIERAKAFIEEADKSVDTFMLPYFISKEGRYIFPESELYGQLGERYERARGKPVPWNQQMMMNNGFIRLAQCHAALGDSPERVKKYDALVKKSIDAFFDSLHVKNVDGHDCYQWSYAADDKTLHYMEDAGHGGYDVMGAYQAYASGRYGVAKEKLVPFANTVKYVMYKDGKFASRVDGSEGAKDYMGATWLFLTEVDPELYSIMAKVDVPRVRTTPQLVARILWAKHQRYLRENKGK